ncbi:sensor domain-containing diguanylate cyclase [Carnobacterium sp.]|uniref:sensor domain-containing diguanylate cyclase n=1 Tax=Carnobacterium sp. TaxID=48221 RepID=UPI003C78746A
MEDTYEELVNELNHMKRLNEELINQVNQNDVTKFPWSENLGHWYWDYTKNVVVFNPKKAGAIGYFENDIPDNPGFEFFTEKLHPEDYTTVMENMRKHLQGILPIWEVKYRIQAKDGSWKVFKDRGKVTQRSADGKPLFLSGIVFDVTKEEEQKEKLKQKNNYWRKKALYDNLTKLYTRSALDEKFVEHHQYALENHRVYSIILLDIDHFKSINDYYGHLAGDGVLAEVGDIILSQIRSTDIAGRYGGEEFLVILPDTDREMALKIGVRIQKELKNINFDTDITLSGGIASVREKSNLLSIIDLADKRLYKAKHNGRNQIINK